MLTKTFRLQPRKRHYFLFFVSLFFFVQCPFSIFSCFLFSFSKIKETKIKSAHFFRKPFLTPWQTAKKTFAPLHTICLFAIPQKHDTIGEKQAKKTWTDFCLNLGQIFDSKKAKSWTDVVSWESPKPLRQAISWYKKPRSQAQLCLICDIKWGALARRCRLTKHVDDHLHRELKAAFSLEIVRYLYSASWSSQDVALNDKRQLFLNIVNGPVFSGTQVHTVWLLTPIEIDGPDASASEHVDEHTRATLEQYQLEWAAHHEAFCLALERLTLADVLSYMMHLVRPGGHRRESYAFQCSSSRVVTFEAQEVQLTRIKMA